MVNHLRVVIFVSLEPGTVGGLCEMLRAFLLQGEEVRCSTQPGVVLESSAPHPNPLIFGGLPQPLSPPLAQAS